MSDTAAVMSPATTKPVLTDINDGPCHYCARGAANRIAGICDECEKPAEFEYDGRTIVCQEHFLENVQADIEAGPQFDSDHATRRAESGYAQ